jgi:epoxide hydrolase 4
MARPAISERDIELPNGQRLHVAEAGSGPLMLFLHGFPEAWFMWRGALEQFGDRYHAVAPDQRGYNLSTKPEGTKHYRAKALVQDILQLADALGHQRFILVAHDWGGAIAWNVAAWHPERIEKLVIVNAPHAVTFGRELATSEAQVAASAYMTLFRQAKAERVMSDDGFRRLRAMSFEQWAANGGPGDPATLAAYVEAWSRPGALTGMLEWYRASPLHPPEPEAPLPALDPEMFRVKVPTLVVWGERDHALLPGNLEGLGEVVDDLRVVRIPDASHWVIHERPAQVMGAIEEFVGR